MSYNLILLQKTKHEHDKWRVLVITVTFLFFVASFLLVMADNIFGIFDRKTETAGLKPRPNLGNPRSNLKGNFKVTPCSENACKITCTEAVETEIEEFSNNLSCENKDIELYLNNIYFTNETIQEGWISKFTKNVSVLAIDSLGLSNLGKRSFNGHPFEELHTLTLVGTKIKYLEKDTFLGLDNVKIFEFRMNNQKKLKSINFENDALEYLADSLESLQIQYCNIQPQALKNLTGPNITGFSNLMILDLRYNEINTIENKTFSGAPAISQLYLTSSQIETLDVMSFYGLEAIQTLMFNGNKLITLPEGIFSGIPSIGRIQIQDNPWQCDCKLLWFKDFYIEHHNTYFKDENLTCHTENGMVNYTQVDFCPTFSTTQIPSTITAETSTATKTATTAKTSITARTATTAKTSITARTPTTVEVSTFKVLTTTARVISSTFDPEEYVNFECEDCLQRSIFKPGIERIYSKTVAVRNGTIIYDFFQIQGTPFYDINVKNLVEDDYMIWINIDDHNDFGCIYNIQEVVTLERLNFNQKYVICLLRQYEDTVSPFDCTSLIVPPNWDNTPWIFNKDKVFLIVLGVVVVLIIIAITSAVVYFLIKTNPKLVHAKQIDKNNRLNSYKDEEYVISPSLYSTSDGYLTSRMYERIQSVDYSRMRRLSRKLSTISERDSEGAFNVVYNVSKINERELYEPPPLPPNHPSKWRKIESEDEISPATPLKQVGLVRSVSLKCDKRYLTLRPEFKKTKSVEDDDRHYLSMSNI